MNTDTQSEKALKSSYFCYFLAFLVMCVTAWFIVEGIQATEPDSPARHAKVAARFPVCGMISAYNEVGDAGNTRDAFGKQCLTLR